jgi:hypothetical protein
VPLRLLENFRHVSAAARGGAFGWPRRSMACSSTRSVKTSPPRTASPIPLVVHRDICGGGTKVDGIDAKRTLADVYG